MLIPKGRTLYFDEKAHKYSDDFGNVYTSCTTLIGKYHEHFDDKKVEIAKACERIGRNPKHEKYLNYKGKTWYQLIKEWELETQRACEHGTKKHNFLESRIKDASGYKIVDGYISSKIYTIDDIIKKHNYGRLNLKRIVELGVYSKYPEIYQVVEMFVNKGFKIYSEIGVYDSDFLISGLIDILLVDEVNEQFVILDWKTNKAPLRFESGYYEKNPDGTLNLERFVVTGKNMLEPISHLADSTGIHYTLQLSLYARLVESFGYKCAGLILCHIRTLENRLDEDMNNEEQVTFHNIEYMRDDVESIMAYHIKGYDGGRNLFI